MWSNGRPAKLFYHREPCHREPFVPPVLDGKSRLGKIRTDGAIRAVVQQARAHNYSISRAALISGRNRSVDHDSIEWGEENNLPERSRVCRNQLTRTLGATENMVAETGNNTPLVSGKLRHYMTRRSRHALDWLTHEPVPNRAVVFLHRFTGTQ